MYERGSSSYIPIAAVLIIGDETLSFERNIAYGSVSEEKNARGALHSAVERDLKADTVVIVDSLNYIKGKLHHHDKEPMPTPLALVLGSHRAL